MLSLSAMDTVAGRLVCVCISSSLGPLGVERGRRMMKVAETGCLYPVTLSVQARWGWKPDCSGSLDQAPEWVEEA